MNVLRYKNHPVPVYKCVDCILIIISKINLRGKFKKKGSDINDFLPLIIFYLLKLKL